MDKLDGLATKLETLAAKLAGVYAVIRMIAEHGTNGEGDALFLINDVVNRVNEEMSDVAISIRHIGSEAEQATA